MKLSMIRKALLSAVAATAVMAATPALAQNVGFSISIGSPGYGHGYGSPYGRAPGYGYGPGHGYGYGDALSHRAHLVSQYIDRLAWSGGAGRMQAHSLAAMMDQYRRLEWRYARNGLSAGEYAMLDARLGSIERRLGRGARSRW